MFKEIVVNYQGKDQKIIAEIVDRKIWFKINQQIYSFDILDLSNRTGKAKASSNLSHDKIMAPMPGKITKIFVSVGQKVKKGDALIVMEAMKMEYTLKSDIEATVEIVNGQLNQQVNLGHLLVKLHPEVTT